MTSRIWSGSAGAALGLGGRALARATVLAPDPPPDPDLVERKLAAPAFTARLRLLVAGGDAEGRRRGLDALVAAYAAYEEPRGNGFVARPCAPARVAVITARGGPRLWRRPWPILNAAEAASLYHLPLAEVDVPGLARAGPRALLPAAEALKTGTPILISTSRFMRGMVSPRRMVENSGAFAPAAVLCSRDREDVEDKHDDGRESVLVGKRVLVPRQCLDEYLSTLMGSTQSA